MSPTVRQTLSVLMLGLASLCVVLAVIGGFKNYSVVPFWDMWDGYLGFYAEVQKGNMSAWWGQHNEHRILLSRLLFWLDIEWFGGLGIFLVVVNYALLACIFVVFVLFLSRLQKEHHPDATQWLLRLVILGWLFSWAQNNNLTWGFQSQFFLAQLLPLCAFFLQALSSAPSARSRGYFFAAVSLGVLSLGTMANGLLALPLMTVLSLLIGAGWKRHLVLAGLSVAAFVFYFQGYVSPAGHGSLSQALLESPLGMLAYVCLYIGGPFFYLGGGEVWAKNVAMAAGAALILGAAILAIAEWLKPTRSSVRLALLAFLLYVGGSALGTAGGRLVLGVELALSSRYMTPALMAWAALLVLLAPNVSRIYQRNALLVSVLAIGLLSTMVWQQRHALTDRTQLMSDRKLAALAAELGVRDEPQLAHVFPFTDWLLEFAEGARETNLSVFGVGPFRDAFQSMSVSEHPVPRDNCQGSVDEVALIPGESNYVRVRGWLLDAKGKRASSSVNLLNNQGVLSGIALAGFPRPDVQDAVVGSEPNAGFVGYVLTQALGQPLYFQAEGLNCKLTDTKPRLPFVIEEDVSHGKAVNVTENQILTPDGWTGSDAWRSKIEGLQVRGSWTNSDADTGVIEIIVSPGDKLLYRSGPAAGKQTMQIKEVDGVSFHMPVSTEWSLLEFVDFGLPGEFTVNLSDDGSGWGEWSSIAVKTKRLD